MFWVVFCLGCINSSENGGFEDAGIIVFGLPTPEGDWKFLLTSGLREVGFLRVERSDLQKFNLGRRSLQVSEPLNGC